MNLETLHINKLNNIYYIKENWWLFALNGIFSFIFGMLALFIPMTTVLGMTIFFGIYAMTDGIFTILSGINWNDKMQHWKTLIFSGALGIAAGGIILVTPQVATFGLSVFLWILIAGWAISTGIFEFIAASRLHPKSKGRILLAFSSLISIILGVSILIILWYNPLVSAVTLGLLIGINFLSSSFMQLFFAFKLYKMKAALRKNK
jgi:uncharacterized membrane protein HdeD (DUF308 family)